MASALSLDTAISLLILVIALGLNLHLLSGISLYFDEAMSVETARQSPGVLASYLWGYQNQMVLYYALLSVWIHLLQALGPTMSELLVRLPSVVFGALAAAVVYLLGRRFWNRMAGLVAAAFYVINTLQLFHAQKARAYPLELLTLNVSWYALLLIISGKDSRRRVWFVWVSAVVLALYSQPYSALVLAAQVAAFVWYAAIPGPWRTHVLSALPTAARALGAVVALTLPLALDFVLHGQPNSFVSVARLSDLQNLFFRMQLGAPSHRYSVDFALMTAVLAGLAIAASARRSRVWNSDKMYSAQANTSSLTRTASAPTYPPPGVVALVAWIVAPIAIAFLTTQPYLNLHLFYWRYLVVVPPLCLLMGIGVSVIRLPSELGGTANRMRLVQGILAVVLVVVAIQQTIGFYATAEISDFRTPASWINAHYRAGDGIVCLPGRMCSVPLEYYLTANTGPAHMTTSSPGAWLWNEQRQVSTEPLYVSKYIEGKPRTFFIEARYGMSALQLAQSHDEFMWLNVHERLVVACTAQTVTVRLYAAGPPIPGQADAPIPHC